MTRGMGRVNGVGVAFFCPDCPPVSKNEPIPRGSNKSLSPCLSMRTTAMIPNHPSPFVPMDGFYLAFARGHLKSKHEDWSNIQSILEETPEIFRRFSRNPRRHRSCRRPTPSPAGTPTAAIAPAPLRPCFHMPNTWITGPINKMYFFTSNFFCLLHFVRVEPGSMCSQMPSRLPRLIRWS